MYCVECDTNDAHVVRQSKKIKYKSVEYRTVEEFMRCYNCGSEFDELNLKDPLTTVYMVAHEVLFHSGKGKNFMNLVDDADRSFDYIANKRLRGVSHPIPDGHVAGSLAKKIERNLFMLNGFVRLNATGVTRMACKVSFEEKVIDAVMIITARNLFEQDDKMFEYEFIRKDRTARQLCEFVVVAPEDEQKYIDIGMNKVKTEFGSSCDATVSIIEDKKRHKFSIDDIDIDDDVIDRMDDILFFLCNQYMFDGTCSTKIDYVIYRNVEDKKWSIVLTGNRDKDCGRIINWLKTWFTYKCYDMVYELIVHHSPDGSGKKLFRNLSDMLKQYYRSMRQTNQSPAAKMRRLI